MRFEKFIPTNKLRSYIKYLIISESLTEETYKVFPSTGLVVGFQYKGHLTSVYNNTETTLNKSGITGISDSYKVFKSSINIGTILVYFTEIGFTFFSSTPANELFNQSISLDHIFYKNQIIEIEEKLSLATTNRQRINIIEQFLLSQLKDIENDKLIFEAVKLIYQSQGTIKIKELNKKLNISQSPLEKCFRKLVGTSPKKFSSIVRFNSVLNNLTESKSLTEICYENNFFDQAHFIKDFKQYTGNTPENFKQFL